MANYTLCGNWEKCELAPKCLRSEQLSVAEDWQTWQNFYVAGEVCHFYMAPYIYGEKK